MALKNVIGIDHAVVMVKDLDQAAANYKRLGFTVSPRGTHSAHMGSGNYTIMFDPDYMELLGVLTPTEHNAPARAYLEKNGEGIERIAFTAVDSADGAEEIRARGYPPVGPTDFERPVTMPMARLRGQIPHLPVADGGSARRRPHLRLPAQDPRDGVDSRTDEACQRRQAPEAGPHRCAGSGQGSRAAVQDDRSRRAQRGGWRRRRAVRRRPGRFVFLTRDQLGKRIPDVSLAGLSERGGEGLVIAADVAAAEKALGTTGVHSAGGIVVPPAAGNGTLLAFVKA